MKLFNTIRSFRKREDGAVTVDWVVLTAAIVGLGIATLAVVRGGVADLSDKIDSQLRATEPFSSSFSSGDQASEQEGGAGSGP
ncbi:MAG: pilus assembly protein [Tropicimonas sp.]|uniref:pilus assembly protein n=1 Tax=Tropicimonas sp. TaxID=2067044 RepID=UPI003A8A22EC